MYIYIIYILQWLQFSSSFQFEAADKGNKALKPVHGMEYTVGCIPCVLCKFW